MRKIWRTLDLKFAKLGNVLKFETAVFAQNLFLEIIHILRIKKSRIVFQKNYLFLFTSSRSYLKGECLTLDVH